MTQPTPSATLHPTRVLPPATPGPSGLGTMAVIIVLIGALYVGREVFIPLVLALLLSFVLEPIISLLRRWYVPRIPSILITVALALAILLAFGGVIGLQIADLAGKLPQYQQTMQTKLAGLQSGAYGRFAALVHRASNAVQETSAPRKAEPQADGGSAPREKPVLVRLPEQEPSPLLVAQTVLQPILSPLTTVGIVLVVAIFLLMQREDLRDRMIRLFGSSDLNRTTMAMDDAAGRLSTYFLTQLGINAGFGLVVAVGLWVIGVPSPILWGAFSLLMRFVPYVGSAISAILPLALSAAVSPGWSMAVETAILFGITETLVGQVVEPLLYGHSTGLSPFAVIVSALFWAWMWGPIGLILSTPFTVLLVVLGRHVEHLEFLDVLLGDRPALTPVENFYQRILAGDPDEAHDQAEKLLKDRPLIDYYDDVALPGLRLAAVDARRGAIAADKLETMRSSMDDLLLDLGRHKDVDPSAPAKKGNADVPTMAEQALPKPLGPPDSVVAERLPSPWNKAGSVLCIAGRGPFDAAAAAVLAQLLERQGLGARVVPHDAVSRRDIDALDLTGVAMVCVAYLEVTGAPSHLRYLLQRLRERLPDAKMLVGLFHSNDALMTNLAVRQDLGADCCADSFRSAVDVCLDQAKSAELRSKPLLVTS